MTQIGIGCKTDGQKYMSEICERYFARSFSFDFDTGFVVTCTPYSIDTRHEKWLWVDGLL